MKPGSCLLSASCSDHAQVVSAAIIRAVGQLKHAVGIMVLFFVVFAILGMGLFQGSLMQRCFYDTSPDSSSYMYLNMSREDFFRAWTNVFGDLTSIRSLEILSPTLHRLNLSNLTARTNVDPSLRSMIEQHAYADNLWRLARPACDGPGLLPCDESYIPPLCQNPVDIANRLSLGGYQCPRETNDSLTVCRAFTPFFKLPNNNPPYFNGWCALGRFQ